MKNYELAVGIVTGILILFVTLIQFEVSQFLIWLIFLAGPFLVIWMVYSVLVADVDIKETFEEQWYQGQPDMRRMEKD
jgi:fatty acid desaturase